MSRSHDDRKDVREGVLSSTGTRTLSLGMASQNVEKDMHEKSNFISHNSGSESSGFRTVDLIKPSKQIQGRPIAPNQLPPMQPLMSGILSGSGHPMMSQVPLPHGPLVRGLGPVSHTFSTHIPIGIGAAAAAVAPPRPGVATTALRTPMPPLKPSNLGSQVQIPITQFQGRPPTIFSSVVTPSRTGSPAVTSSSALSHTSEHRSSEGRSNVTVETHHNRGNTQALGSSQPSATIQVIASGAACQLPSSGHSTKNLGANAASNILKIGGALQHSSFSQPFTTSGSPAVSTVTGFKFPTVSNNIYGKNYPPQPPVLVSSTSALSAITRLDPMDHVEHKSVALTTSSHHTSVTTSSHHSLHSTCSSSSGGHSHSAHLVHPSNALSEGRGDRQHNIGQPGLEYYLQSPAFARHITMQSFSPSTFHSLVRPPSVQGSFPMGLAQPLSLCPTVPSSKGSLVSSDSNFGSHNVDTHSTNHASATFPIQSLFPNVHPQISAYPAPVSTASSNGASPRPAILKRNRDGIPVPATDRISSPVKLDFQQSNSRSSQNSPKNSIEPASSGEGPTPSSETTTANGKNLPSPTLPEVTRDIDSKAAPGPSPAIPLVHPTAVPVSVSATSQLNTEASPRKKPRKQLVITTEDRFSTNTSLEENQSSEDEVESLKAKEPPLKDLTPPLKVKNNNQHKVDTKLDTKKEDQIETDESLKYFRFRGRPRVRIIADYKVNNKAAHNHFFRYSDVRIRDEKKVLTVSEIVNQKSIYLLASGWKLHHLSSQLDDLSVLEDDVCRRMLQFQQILPRPSKQHLSTASSNPHRKKSVDEQLRVLHELIQGNIQRCQLSIEQLAEAKQTMLKVIDHKPKVLEIVKKYRQKRPKKKLSPPT